MAGILLKNFHLLERFHVLARRFAQEGVPMAPLKGLSFLIDTYDDPLQRATEDLDLFIDRADFSSAARILQEEGYAFRSPMVRGVMENHGQETSFVSQDGIEVDLHYRLFAWYEERHLFHIASREWFRRSEEKEWKGVLIHLLRKEDELFYVLLTLVRGKGGPERYFLDADAIVRKHGDGIDWNEFSRLLRTSPVQRQVQNLMNRLTKKYVTPFPTSALTTRLRPRPLHFMADRLRLASLYFKWNAFKRTGIFADYFKAMNNPVPALGRLYEMEAIAFGTSMLPFIRPASEMEIQPLLNAASVGDVLMFEDKRGRIITHRLVKLMGRGDDLKYLMKADNALDFDGKVEPARVLGRVIRIGGRDIRHFWWHRWRGLVALLSYIQGVFYARLARSRVNRWRHRLEKAGRLPAVKLSEGFKGLTFPFGWVGRSEMENEKRRRAFSDEKFFVRPMGDECVVMNLKDGRYYTFNHTAALVFKLAREKRSVPDILAVLRRWYGELDGPKTEEDIRAFIDDLETEGILS